MSATLTIEVPEELLMRLQSQAAQVGKTPEALAAEYLSAIVPDASRVGLRRWAGAFASGVSDASVRHDEYLGHALFDELGE
jgi:predicted transcriptional regulator